MKKVLVVLSILMLSLSMFGQIKEVKSNETSNIVKGIVKGNGNFYLKIDGKFKKTQKMNKGDTISVDLSVRYEDVWDYYYLVTYKDMIGYSNSFKLINKQKSNEITFLSNIPDDLVNQNNNLKYLNDRLYEAHKTTGIGVSMFIGGVTTSIVGVLVMNSSKTGDDAVMNAGLAFVIIGGLSATVSIPVMVIGNKRATEVLFQMMQHDQQNITSMGIGVRKTF